MLIRMCNTDDFSVTLALDIDDGAELINLIVKTVWHGKNRTIDFKVFGANEYKEALAYYKKQERMFCK